MNSIPLPDDLINLAGYVILAAVTLVTARWTSRKVGKVQDQVQNNHPTNLRDDIDKIAAAQQKTHEAVQNVQEHQWEHSRAISGIYTVISQLSTEIQDESKVRAAADQALNEHIRVDIQRHPE